MSQIINISISGTNGITLPSSESQTVLIRETYVRAGLDWHRDRCQYFEAHGTGTPAGDPIEARAIHDAFFPDNEKSDHVMYVGSIKTVVGHLEGCAGIAGLIKASEAVRRGVIPPNMLFEHLNPAIAPYYNNLRIPQETIPWPKLGEGIPRRASINSFGTCTENDSSRCCANNAVQDLVARMRTPSSRALKMIILTLKEIQI